MQTMPYKYSDAYGEQEQDPERQSPDQTPQPTTPAPQAQAPQPAPKPYEAPQPQVPQTFTQMQQQGVARPPEPAPAPPPVRAPAALQIGQWDPSTNSVYDGGAVASDNIVNGQSQNQQIISQNGQTLTPEQSAAKLAQTQTAANTEAAQRKVAGATSGWADPTSTAPINALAGGDTMPPPISAPANPGVTATPNASITSMAPGIDINAISRTDPSGSAPLTSPGLQRTDTGGQTPSTPPTISPTGAPASNTAPAASSDILQMLLGGANAPGSYGTDQTKAAYNWLGGQIDDQYALKQKALDDSAAARGLGTSTIKAGQLNDLNIGQRNAKESLAYDLADKQASQGAAAQQSRLQWLQSLMGYGQQGFNNDLATANFNANQNNSYQDWLLNLLGIGYKGAA